MTRKYLDPDGFVWEVSDDWLFPGEHSVFRRLPGGGLYRAHETTLERRADRVGLELALAKFALAHGFKEMT